MYSELFPLAYYFYPLLENDSAPTLQAERTRSLMCEPAAGAESLLYLHVPFCHDLCQFCPFHVKVAKDSDAYERYTRTLRRELTLLATQPALAGRRFSAVYFGGGSPSILGPRLVEELFNALRELFQFVDDVEITFEGEPRTLGAPDLLQVLKDFGVSRISFGLQTYEQAHRQRFRIQASLADVERVTENARRLGFRDVNVDMMYDLPGQTVSALSADIRRLAEAGYDSIDYYNLHYYAFPKPFKAALEQGQIPAKPSQQAHLALAQELRWQLSDLGYNGVADQIFSKDSSVCEYFRLLWGGGRGRYAAETVAAGSSARGYLRGHSYMNVGDLATYAAQLGRGELPIAKVSSRLTHEASRGAFFMPKFFGIDKRETTTLATIEPSLLDAWITHGLVMETESAFELTEHGRLWTSNMMRDLLEPAQSSLAQGALTALKTKPGTRTGTF